MTQHDELTPNPPQTAPALASAALSKPIGEAMTFMVVAMLVVPLMDVLAKLLSTNYGVSPLSIVGVRFWGQAILLGVAVLFWLGPRGLGGQSKVLNLLRGMLVGASVGCFFVALKYLPLADAIAIFFVEPFVVMFLSVPFLGERFGWRRALAAAVGLGGAMLIVQPSYSVFGTKALLPLGAAVFFACYLILSRSVGRTDHPLTMQFWAGIGGGIMATFAILVGGHLLQIGDMQFSLPLGGVTLAWLFLLILVATSSHLLIVIAFSKAPASILAPFQYLEIITMTVAGYLVFGEFPTAEKWLGIALIIGSGIYVFNRERRLEIEEKPK